MFINTLLKEYVVDFFYVLYVSKTCKEGKYKIYCVKNFTQ